MVNIFFFLQFCFLFVGKPLYSMRYIFNVNFILGKPSKLFDRTNPDWVPSLKLGHKKSSYVDGNDDMHSRYLRTKRRAEKRLRIEKNEEKTFSKNKKKETEVTNINDSGLFEETPSSSELDFMVSSINGLNENSFLNPTLLLPNCSENNSKETHQTNLSMADILGTE